MSVPSFTKIPHPGLCRRELLQVGSSAVLGLSLASLPTATQAAAARKRNAKSVILVFLTGAPSHIDTLDPKPDAPKEIRGEFKTIATKMPGIQFSEHVPQLAARSDKFAVVRSLAHRENNHLVATHNVLTGHKQPGAFFDKVASRDDFPNYAGTLDYLRPRHDGVPTGVNLPTFLVEGPLTCPGQHAGFLGPKHDPWQLRRDPNAPDFQMDSLRLPQGLEVNRLRDRRALLEDLNRQQKHLDHLGSTSRISEKHELAFSLLTSGAITRAFEIDREPQATRDRYGRHAFGQSLLLARRLVEAGVSVVQANMGHVQNWDNHGDIFPTLKNRLLPPLDRGVSALLDDLEARGLLDETLVVMLGEFGRTPKMQGTGRDHWAQCFFGLFAGAGVRGGQIIGKSDAIGGYPITTPYTPEDVGATVYDILSVAHAVEVRDRQSRPVSLNHGKAIDALFTGATG